MEKKAGAFMPSTQLYQRFLDQEKLLDQTIGSCGKNYREGL